MRAIAWVLMLFGGLSLAIIGAAKYAGPPWSELPTISDTFYASIGFLIGVSYLTYQRFNKR